MSDYSDFAAALRDHHNRDDWSDALVALFIRTAEQKFNAELRVGRMIQSSSALIASRCAPLPDDWLEMSLIKIENANAPTGFTPIRYKSRDEFYRTADKWSEGFYTIEGRQIYFGGVPDAVNGQTVSLSYYGEVPVFSNDTDSWVYTKYPALYLSAASLQAYLHAVGEEQLAAGAKTFTEDMIQKLNAEWLLAKASGSRLTRTRTRRFG